VLIPSIIMASPTMLVNLFNLNRLYTHNGGRICIKEVYNRDICWQEF